MSQFQKGGVVMRRKTDLHILVRVGTAIVGLIALGSCLVFAQGSTGAISGVVRDATGAVIPGVTVTARHIESGLTRTAVSSETGGYNFHPLPAGAHQITTELPGFKQAVRRGIKLVGGQQAVGGLNLGLGAGPGCVT